MASQSLDYSPRPFSNMRYEINEAVDNGYIEARHLTDDELEKVLNLEKMKKVQMYDLNRRQKV